jgi:hypothetical protein
MIAITGDLHGDQGAHKLKTLTEDKRFEDVDISYLIILGDFGLFWQKDHSTITSSYWLRYISRQSYTTLFIDGNHENFPLLADRFNTVEKFGDEIGQYKESDKLYHLRRGRIYTIEDKTFFAFGGATSIDKHLRKEGVSWWPEEIPSNEEFNLGIASLEKYNHTVDYVITHSCPTEIFNADNHLNLDSEPVRGMLSHFNRTVSCKNWFFGHYHKDAQIDDKFVLLYNGFWLI